jgi:polyisoprenoid-binding protein YceI
MILRKFVGTILGVVVLASAAFSADTYKLDPVHTRIGFSVTHLVINKVDGRFKNFDGTVTLDPKATNAVTGAHVTIQANSVDTSVAKRDDDLRSPNFFDVQRFPTITFEGKRVEQRNGHPVMVGTLTIHGVAKEIALPFTVKGPIKDPWGNIRIGIEANTTLNRQDYGMTFNKTLDNGGLIVGNDVDIHINAEAFKAPPPKKQ